MKVKEAVEKIEELRALYDDMDKKADWYKGVNNKVECLSLERRNKAQDEITRLLNMELVNDE